MKCQYVSDEEGRIGVDTECWIEGAALVCTADATAILRLKSGGASGYQEAQFWNKRLPACKPHSEHLAEDAEIEWEILERFLDPEEVDEKLDVETTAYPQREMEWTVNE